MVVCFFNCARTNQNIHSLMSFPVPKAMPISYIGYNNKTKMYNYKRRTSAITYRCISCHILEYSWNNASKHRPLVKKHPLSVTCCHISPWLRPLAKSNICVNFVIVDLFILYYMKHERVKINIFITTYFACI